MTSASITAPLKAELWRRFGSPDFPAEWDGQVYGGGKVSQRFWEYFKTIELLDLDRSSVVLDIGGGSPQTGLGFLASILATQAKQVIVVDPCVAESHRDTERARFIRKNAGYEELSRILKEEESVTHVSCVSVFEHIEPAVREGITRAINDHFRGVNREGGGVFVTTFEYHSRFRFFDQQLTSKTASDLFKPFDRFYLDRYEASPVGADNSFDIDPVLRSRDRRFPWQRLRFVPSFAPKWYPVAMRFLKI